MIRGILALVGLILVGAGVGVYSWPAGLIVFGAGLYVDTILGKSNGADK